LILLDVDIPAQLSRGCDLGHLRDHTLQNQRSFHKEEAKQVKTKLNLIAPFERFEQYLMMMMMMMEMFAFLRPVWVTVAGLHLHIWGDDSKLLSARHTDTETNLSGVSS
jgi:hypothetical protein